MVRKTGLKLPFAKKVEWVFPSVSEWGTEVAIQRIYMSLWLRSWGDLPGISQWSNIFGSITSMQQSAVPTAR